MEADRENWAVAANVVLKGGAIEEILLGPRILAMFYIDSSLKALNWERIFSQI